MKYKLVAALLDGSAQEETKCLDGEYFEKTYPIDSNVEEEFKDCITDYVFDFDGDGIYLFKKIQL